MAAIVWATALWAPRHRPGGLSSCAFEREARIVIEATGTEPTPSAHAKEAARLASLFIGDLAVVAHASEDRRMFGPFVVEHPNEQIKEFFAKVMEGSERERRAWPLAGRALLTGDPVVLENIVPGELEGLVNPAMDQYLSQGGLTAVAFVAMRTDQGHVGILGLGRGPGRPPYTRDEIAAAQAIADLATSEDETPLLVQLLRPGHTERAFSDAERRFRVLVERVPAVVYEAEPGAEGRWNYVSPYIGTLLGYAPGEWLEEPALWSSRVHPDDRDAVLAAEGRLSAGERVAMEYRMLARDGSIVWVHDDAHPRQLPSGGWLLDGLLTDITDRKASEARLQHLADHDALTRLLNRRRFLEELDLEVAVVKRGMRSSAAIVLDIDGFKYVNDSLGHQAGDELLRTVAGLLSDRLRASDAVARLGGDEFACLLRGTDAARAEEVARELLEAFRSHHFDAAGEEGVRVTASAGVASLDDATEATAESVLSSQ